MSNLNISRAKRLDQYVIETIPQLSRSFAVKLIEDGKVLVNDEPVLKAGSKIREGSRIVIAYDVHELEKIPVIELPIIYEDEDCLVVNKPAGVLTHSKGMFNPEATVETFVRKYASNMVGNRVGIVHRLDRATSGVIICAKHAAALVWLQKQFSQRKVKKTYMAIIAGHLKQEHALIDMPIERNPSRPQLFRVGAHGKSAQTEYKVISSNEVYSLLELSPQTGRTHQLRVHLAQLGHPIIGDTLYGGAAAGRLYLHATRLEITLSNRQRSVFEAPLPDEFAAIMKR